MRFVCNLIIMLFVVLNPSQSSTHPKSDTKEKNTKKPSTEERVKARLEELGIPPEGAQCPFLMKFFNPAKVTFLPCQYIPRKPRYQSVLTCHQMSSHTGT